MGERQSREPGGDGREALRPEVTHRVAVVDELGVAVVILREADERLVAGPVEGRRQERRAGPPVPAERVVDVEQDRVGAHVGGYVPVDQNRFDRSGVPLQEPPEPLQSLL
jgi:hypothetical protein